MPGLKSAPPTAAAGHLHWAGVLEDLITSYRQPSDREVLGLFGYQSRHNRVYAAYLHALGRDPRHVRQVNEIPCLPVSLFCTHRLKCWNFRSEAIWCSSGTAARMPSRHFVPSVERFHRLNRIIFEHVYGDCGGWIFLALLPSYLERRNSGLVCMVDGLMQAGGHPLNGYFLYDHRALAERYRLAASTHKRVMLFGVGFALLDLAGSGLLDMRPQDVVLETGGMKGRGPELVREALHERLCRGLKTGRIHTEYGMTEMSSSIYSGGSPLLIPPPWVRLRVQELHDPLGSVPPGRTGTLDIIDFANIHSCSFLKTDDLGWMTADGSFQVVGRRDESEWRGCNLLYQPA